MLSILLEICRDFLPQQDVADKVASILHKLPPRERGKQVREISYIIPILPGTAGKVWEISCMICTLSLRSGNNCIVHPPSLERRKKAGEISYMTLPRPKRGKEIGEISSMIPSPPPIRDRGGQVGKISYIISPKLGECKQVGEIPYVLPPPPITGQIHSFIHSFMNE